MNEAEGSLITAAHELKTPLVLMRQLSIQLAQTDDASKRAAIVERIRLTAERSLRLTDNLTKSIRLADTLFELEPVQLNNICSDVVEEISPLTHALGQKITVGVMKKPLVVVANRDLLRSLLLGLIDNAAQYNNENQCIEITSRINRRSIAMSVRDHGPVIDLGEFRRLQRSVGQELQPLSSRPLSSGLGLMIANRFTEAMNGKLSLARHRSGGMTFTIDLPACRQLSLIDG